VRNRGTLAAALPTVIAAAMASRILAWGADKITMLRDAW